MPRYQERKEFCVALPEDFPSLPSMGTLTEPQIEERKHNMRSFSSIVD